MPTYHLFIDLDQTLLIPTDAAGQNKNFVTLHPDVLFFLKDISELENVFIYLTTNRIFERLEGENNYQDKTRKLLEQNKPAILKNILAKLTQNQVRVDKVIFKLSEQEKDGCFEMGYWEKGKFYSCKIAINLFPVGPIRIPSVTYNPIFFNNGQQEIRYSLLETRVFYFEVVKLLHPELMDEDKITFIESDITMLRNTKLALSEVYDSEFLSRVIFFHAKQECSIELNNWFKKIEEEIKKEKEFKEVVEKYILDMSKKPDEPVTEEAKIETTEPQGNVENYSCCCVIL